MLGANRIAVVLRQRAIADHEQLHILKQTGTSPERFTLIAVNLIERLTQINTTALQFHMHHRQTVHQDRHVIPIGVGSLSLVLVDDLQTVVVDVVLVDQDNVLGRTIVALKQLHMIFLDPDRLLDNPILLARNTFSEEPAPLRI